MNKTDISKGRPTHAFTEKGKTFILGKIPIFNSQFLLKL